MIRTEKTQTDKERKDMSKKYLVCKTITPLPKNCIVISDHLTLTFITGVVAVEETDLYIFIYDETDRISHVFDKSEGYYIEDDYIDRNGMSFYDRLLLDNEERETHKKQYVPEECSTCPYFGYDDDDEDYKGLQHCLFRKLRGDNEIAPCDEDDFDILEVEDYDGDFLDDECNFGEEDD